MRSPRLALSLCLMAAYGWVATVHAEDLTPTTVWMTNFAKAQAEAKRLHRPVVVHFHTHTCPPCRQMERDLLHTAPVLKLLDGGFIAVKVDMNDSANVRVVQKYKVEAMPTDVVLDEDGAVLHRTTGYDARTSADRQKYIAALNRIDAKYASEGKRLAPSTTPLATVGETPKAADSPAVAANRQGAVSKLVPEPVEARLIEEGTEPTSPAAIPKANDEISPSLVALDGYCPVTLRTTRTWKKGDRQFAWVYDGQTFLFEAADKREEFKADPSRYAPKLLGCDPVVLAESNLAIRGSTKFGAFYEGELFLFESADTRAKFRKEPTRFIRIKHVLKPEDVKEARDAKDVHKLAITVSK